MPELLNFDTGEKLIFAIKKMGYAYYVARNTHNDSNVLQIISDSFPLKYKSIDIAINDEGVPFFLHLGRGVIKSAEKGFLKKNSNKLTEDQWFKIIKKFL
jgi:hypothetical protein